MTSFAKLLLVGTVAVVAASISAAPSLAKGKAKACIPGSMCTMKKTNVVHHCDGSKKLVAVLLPACQGGGCPPRC